MTYLHAIIIAIVEGITEFLPISSTAHMILTATLLGIPQSSFVKLFEICIQFGAILAVIYLYHKRFLSLNIKFLLKLLYAVIPALIFGYFFNDHIESIMEKPSIILLILGVGGILFLFIEKYLPKPSITNVDELSNKQAIFIGISQVVSIILPGFSRSAATILGGMFQGCDRKTAAEFSFFLAVPTMFAASAKSGLDYYQEFGLQEIKAQLPLLLLGNIVAFLVAIVAIKWLVKMLETNGLKPFGYYRIGLACLLFLMAFCGLIHL